MSAGAPSRSGVLRSSSLRKAPTDSNWLQVDNRIISGTACSGDSSYKEGLTGWVATISRGATATTLIPRSPSRSGSKPPKECSSMVLDQIGYDHNADFSYLEQHRNTEASPTVITAA